MFGPGPEKHGGRKSVRRRDEISGKIGLRYILSAQPLPGSESRGAKRSQKHEGALGVARPDATFRNLHRVRKLYKGTTFQEVPGNDLKSGEPGQIAFPKIKIPQIHLSN